MRSLLWGKTCFLGAKVVINLLKCKQTSNFLSQINIFCEMTYRDLSYFLAERLVELYDWGSIDSYRVRCHNALSLIMELRDVTDGWVKGNIIDFNRVVLCANETIEEVKKDVALDFLYYDKDLFMNDIKSLASSDKNKNHEICNRVVYLLDRCIEENEKSYIDTLYYNISLIIDRDEELAVEDFKPVADELNRLVTALACALINEGYSQRHLYNKATELLEDMDNFSVSFRKFKQEHNRDVEKKGYEIWFKVYGGFNQRLLNVDGFSDAITPGLIGQDSKRSFQNFAITQRKWIFYHCHVKAHDSVMAISFAKENMDREIDRAVLGYSMISVRLHRNVFVVANDPNGDYQLLRPMNVLDTSYADDANVAELMKSKLDSINVNDKISQDVKDRLRSALRHLRMGNSETDAGQQLVNYWVALEFLFSSPRSDDSTIKRLEVNLTNVLTCGYVRRRVEFLNEKIKKDMVLSEGEKWWTLDVNGLDRLIKKQKSLLMRHHLLQMKSHLYGNSDKAKDYINTHRNHLIWQIYRTYRYRNQLIHEAAILPGLDNVIRYLHYYLVFMLNQMIGYFTATSLKSVNMDSFFYEYGQIFNKINSNITKDGLNPSDRIKVMMDVPLYYELIKKNV